MDDNNKEILIIEYIWSSKDINRILLIDFVCADIPFVR